MYFKSKQEALEYLDKISSQLAEHFDHVQIMVAWDENGESHCLFLGSGNWYARQGMAHEFIAADNARINAFEMKQAED